MAALATACEPGTAAGEAPAEKGSASRLFEPGGVTLEDAILGAWEELVAEGRAECPVCGGRLGMLRGCEDCGSELS